MTIALVVSTGKNGTGGATVTTDAIDTTGVNLLVVAVGNWNDIGTLTDNKLNTWEALSFHGGSGQVTRIYYCLNPTVGIGHTLSISCTNPSLCVAGFSGVKTLSAFDTESGSDSSNAPGSITPAESNELFVTSICWYFSGTLTINSSFLIASQINYSSGNGMGCALGYKITSADTAESPVWSSTDGFSGVTTAMATFKEDASPPLTPKTLLRRRRQLAA